VTGCWDKAFERHVVQTDVERALDHLFAGDHAKLRHWLDGLEGRRLDDRIGRAVDLGDGGTAVQLADEALADHEAGRSRQSHSRGRPWRRLVRARGNE
jgi:hypothetical protein